MGYPDAVSSQKFRFQAGDILFGKLRPYFHKAGLAFADGITSSDAIVIRAISDDLGLPQRQRVRQPPGDTPFAVF